MIPITWILSGKKILKLFANPLTWLALFVAATVLMWFLWRGAVDDLRAAGLECDLRATMARAQALDEAEKLRRFIQDAQQDALGELATKLAIATKAAEHWYRRYEEARTEAESPCNVQASQALACPLGD